MSKKYLVIFFVIGLAAALIVGLLVYESSLTPSGENAEQLIRDFVSTIAEGDLSKARSFLTTEGQAELRNPTNALSEAAYRELKIVSIDNLTAIGNDGWVADVTLQTIDTLQVMAKANTEFWQKLSENGDTEADAMLEEIYETLIARDDIPTISSFCIMTLTQENGELKIVPDEKLINAIEGNIEENADAMDAIIQVIDER